MAYEYHLSPLMAAQEGDTRPLCQRLHAIATKLGKTDATVVRYAADLIDGKIKKRPPNRPASVVTHLRHKDMARHVEELTSQGWKQDAAVAAVMEEFECKRATVMNALKKARPAR